MKKILITGMSGLIGGAVRKQLEGNYELRALNRSAVEGVDCHRADISDLDAIRPAFEGIDTVVHMAAAIKSDFEGFTRHGIRLLQLGVRLRFWLIRLLHRGVAF